MIVVQVVIDTARPTAMFKMFLRVKDLVKLPYRQQITSVSCGAAVIEMILAHCGISRSQKEIIRKLQFDDHGAHNTSLIKLIESFSISCEVYAQQSEDGDSHIRVLSEEALVHLLAHLDDGKLVILNYIAEDGIGHYVLAHSYNKDHLIVHDPDPIRGGPNVVLKKEYFERRWISGDSKWQKWFAVVTLPSKVSKVMAKKP